MLRDIRLAALTSCMQQQQRKNVQYGHLLCLAQASGMSIVHATQQSSVHSSLHWSCRMYATAAARSDGLLLLCGGRDESGTPLGDAYGLARHRDGRWEWATAPGQSVWLLRNLRFRT